MSPSILVGILQVERDPWISIAIEGQSTTWLSRVPEQVEILHVFGRRPGLLMKHANDMHERLRRRRYLGKALVLLDRATASPWKFRTPPYSITHRDLISGRVLNSKVPEMLYTLPWKEFALFHYFLVHTDYEFLYMTNTSSYVQLDLLRNWVENSREPIQYGGSILDQGAFLFASGANRILSRHLVERLVRSRSEWDFGKIDDVAMGRVISVTRTVPSQLPSITINSYSELQKMDDSYLRNMIHFRLRVGSEKAREDAQLMRLLHQRLAGIH